MLQITELRKKDMRKAIQFAIKGMHFDWYMDSKLELNLYGRYFWYLESNKATQMIALYDDDRLAGVLLAFLVDRALHDRHQVPEQDIPPVAVAEE